MGKPYDIDAELAHVQATARHILEESTMERETRPEMLSEGGMMEKARRLVQREYYSEPDQFFLRDRPTLPLDDIYIVWFSKTLQNWKCLISTNVADDMYYEVTHNGDKSETYIDQYHKVKNVCVPD